MAYMANYQEEPELVAEQLREVSFLNLYFDWTSIQNTYPAFQVRAVNCFFTHTDSTSGPYFYETSHMQILI